MIRPWVCGLLLASSLWLSVAPARADDLVGPSHPPTDVETAEARGQYQAGNAAADAGQFADALRLFTRAYALSGNPAALYNAARTLRSLGRHAEARRAFDQLLSSFADLSEATRTEATRLRDEEATRVAELTLEGVPAADPALVLHVDGVFRPDGGARPIHIELDAGEHGLLLELTGYTPFTWQGVLAEGARERVSVSLAPVPAGRSIADEPAFWIVLAVVVLAGAAVGGYFLWDSQQLRPESGAVIHL